MEEDEIIISFDVAALFPSVPIDIAIGAIRTHLEKQNLPADQVNAYINAIDVCMKYNCFQFRNVFYENKFGCSMGNSLSPLVAEAFMSKFESDLKNENLLPRIWFRYVDDTFAVIKAKDIDATLNILNNRYESIKFTYEREDPVNHTLPFLDVLIKRDGKHISFDVYRKPTSTDRYITSDSFCTRQNKLAAFHSMVYRLCRLPLSNSDFSKELDHIMHIADVNGYEKSLVEKLVYKHSKKINKSLFSTLFNETQTSVEHRVSMCYAPNITNKLKYTFQRANMHIVHTNTNKLRHALGTTKDTVPVNSRSGIYEITCSDCDAKYIGQTRRAVQIRINEHLRSVKNMELHKAIPSHVFDLNNSRPHHIESFENNVKLIKNVNKPSKLDAYESLYIAINDNLMNLENGPIESPLFKLI